MGRKKQRWSSGTVRDAEATYDSRGVFGFHAEGRFLSGLFEAFFSLFHPGKIRMHLKILQNHSLDQILFIFWTY